MRRLVNSLFNNSYALTYIGITILLWDTFGMLGTSNPYPIALIFMTIFAWLMWSKKDKKLKQLQIAPLLKVILTVEIILHIIAYLHLPHSNFHFAKEVQKESFVMLFLVVIVSFWILHLLKEDNKWWKFFLVGISSLFLFFVVYVALNPGIDTFHYMEIAAEEFINNRNPYLVSFADYYNGKYKDVYGGKYVFNYWPISLYLCSFSKLIFSDVRYIMVIFQLFLGIVLLMNSCRNRNHKVWLYFYLLWILNPVVAFVNIQAWVDAFAPLFLLLTVVFLQRKKFLVSAFALGLLASIKLYYCFTVPFMLIFIWSHQKKFFLKYVALTFFGFIVTFVPFLLLSPNELFYNTVIYFTKSQLRLESLSYTAYLKYFHNIDLSRIGLLLSILFLLLGYAKSFLKKLNLLQVLQVMNFSYLAFFLFSKQAFCNYYYYNLFLTFLLLYYSIRSENDIENNIAKLVN